MEQMPSNDPVVESKPGPAGWVQTWIMAVTKPNENTFVILTERPEATSRTAFIWVFIAGMISSIMTTILQAIYAAMGGAPQIPIPGLEDFQQFNQYNQGGGSVGVTLLIGLCASPLGGLLAVLFFAIITAIVQWIAKLFGGTGSFEKLAYALAAITVPFTLISAILTLLGAIPFVGYCTGIISFGLWIYNIVLQVMAVKAVNRFGYGQAVGSVFIPGCLVFLICACVVIGSLALLGPVINEVFQGIQQGLPTAP